MLAVSDFLIVNSSIAFSLLLVCLLISI